MAKMPNASDLDCIPFNSRTELLRLSGQNGRIDARNLAPDAILISVAYRALEWSSREHPHVKENHAGGAACY